MALRQKYIEYHTFNVNTFSDLSSLKEELYKLLTKNFSFSVVVTAYDNNEDRECSSTWKYCVESNLSQNEHSFQDPGLSNIEKS